jgi:hypothetical protein
MVIDEWLDGKDLEGSGIGQIKVQSQHFPRGTEETSKYLRMGNVPPEIRNKHPRNTSLELHL